MTYNPLLECKCGHAARYHLNRNAKNGYPLPAGPCVHPAALSGLCPCPEFDPIEPWKDILEATRSTESEV